MNSKQLRKKILYSILAANAIGFGYTSTMYAATVNNDNHQITNDNIQSDIGSCKLIVGQGNLDIQTTASVGTILAKLPSGDILGALAPVENDNGKGFKYAPLVGVIGGEGKIDAGTSGSLGIVNFIPGKLPASIVNGVNKIIKTDTLDTNHNKQLENTFGSETERKDININIGGKNSEPVVIGLVGGDFSFNSNMDGKKIEDQTALTRFGDVNINTNSGNLLGGVGASAAISVGNIDAQVNLEKILKLDYVTNGDTKTIINGNVTNNVNNGANIAGYLNGGAAVAIGGKAESIVNGNSNVNINAKVDGQNLEGLSVGVAGGGLAVSTLGSTATSTVNGDTTINVNNGLTAGLVGGGMAGSVDATWVGSKVVGDQIGNNGNFTDITDEQLEKLLGMNSGIPDSTITLHGVYDGGTATATTKDTNIKLTGTTTAVGVIGGGVAGAIHNFVARGDEHGQRPDGVNQGQILGQSNANVQTGITHIDVNVQSKTGEDLTPADKGELINGLKGIAQALTAKDKIEALKDATTKLQDKGAVIGVIGGGVAVGYSGNNAGLAENTELSKGANATATNEGAEINLNNGYVVGTFGGGVALSNRTAHSTVETTGDVTVNLNGAEAIGVFGNGVAGMKISGHGFAKTTAKNTNININAGSADGVFGGGLAVTTGTNKIDNATVETTGTSTININGEVNKLNYDQLNGVFGKNAPLNGMFGDQFEAVKTNAKDVAIMGGGVAAGEGAVSHVVNSIININTGANIKGDIVAGGLAVENGKSTVDNSTINWNGGIIEGQLNGSDIGSKEASVKNNSTLNINGDVELNAIDKDSKQVSKITQFGNVNFKAGTTTTVSGIQAGNNVALIYGLNGTINVENGARLNISKLEKSEDKYLIADKYKEDSKLWENSALAYDRTECYATGTNKDGQYTISYKDLSQLNKDEQNAAIDDFVDSLGQNGEALQGIVSGLITNKDNTFDGAKDFFQDITTSDNLNNQALVAGTLFGEVAGVTSNTISMAQDMAENAFLRLSLTQDTINAEPIDENGAIWAKYAHNKHKVDGLGSSLGDIHSDSSYDGITVGYDFNKTGDIQTGVAFSYFDGDGNGLGVNNDFDMWGLNIYGNMQQGDMNYIADLGFSQGSNDLTGYVNGKNMTADRDLSVISAGIRAEKLYTQGNTQIVPYAGLRYMNINSDDYTTYYDGKAAFRNSGETQNVWTLPIGVSLRNETVTNSGWRVTPQADLAYVWAFGDTDSDLTVNAGSGVSVLNYDIMDSGSWIGSVGIEAAKDNLSFGIGYSYQKGSNEQDNKWFANINYSF